MVKLEISEYIIHKCIEWYKNVNNINSDDVFNKKNDFSKLKIMKLLFFVIVSSNENDKGKLLDIFDNFYAEPYGHFEHDINGKIKDFKHYLVHKNSLFIKDNNIPYINSDIKSIIDSSIDNIKKYNFKFINYNSIDLIDIEHQFFSWKYFFDKARKDSRYSEKVPTSCIQHQIVYYTTENIEKYNNYIEEDLTYNNFKIDESKIIKIEPLMLCSVCFQKECSCFSFKRIFKKLFNIKKIKNK